MDNRYLKLDWLGFTFKPVPSSEKSPLEQFLDMFPEFQRELFIIPEFNLGKGYKSSMLYCDIVVSYNPLELDQDPLDIAHAFNMGVNVQVSSHVLDMFCAMLGIDYNSEYAFRNLVLVLYERDCKLSRVDICYDDFDKRFDASYYIQKASSKLIATPCHKVTMIQALNDNEGSTIYFGSLKKRKKLLRIYDKFAESGGEIDAVRYEFEYHGDYANRLADILIDYDGKLPFFDMLVSVCRVVDIDSKNKDISDRKTDENWMSTLNGDLTLSSSSIKICPRKKDKLTSLNYFIEHQAVSSIAGYVKCFGREALYQLITDAIHAGKINARYMSFYNKLKYCNELFDTSNPLLDDNPFL